jgi:two-component system phosphate regulon sensor histidine kinase PhoR
MLSGDPSGREGRSSRFFRNLFVSYAAILLATGGLIAWQVQERLAQGLRRELQRSLETYCVLVEPLALRLLDAEPARVQAELARLRAERDVRVTLVQPDGTVVADSQADPGRLDNHSQRTEIVQARTQPFGTAERRSHSVGARMFYVARRVERGGQLLGFTRMAVPLERGEALLADARRSVFLGTGVGVLFALVVGYFVAARIERPIRAMTRGARALLAGDYSTRVPVGRRDELGLLGEALNELGAQITQRIAALSQEDAQLHAMLASMIEGVVAVDEQDRVAFVNQAARDLLAIGADRTEGRVLWDLVPIRELEALLRRVRAGGGHERVELDLHRGGKECTFQAHASPFRGGGKGGFVLVLHDITELRRLERIRRDFVANVSHELKTPLTSIQGFVETLLAGALQDEHNNQQFLRRIEANVRRLTSLVSDLLSLARIESGQLEVARTTVDWREVLWGVLRLREPALAAKGLALVVRGDERALRVRGDPEAMTQVLDNLLDNAIQYTPAPGRIEVRLASEGGHGLVAVADTGIGIPAADLERIFERFYRVDKARSRAAGGTGLGLSIVKNLVLRMEGDVRVASVEGRGSTFTVRLPLA